MSDYSAQNWSGHVSFDRSAIHEPTSVTDLQEIVAGAERVGVIGSRHSFNDIANTDGDLLWLGGLDPAIEIDRQQMTASFASGTTYEQLGAALHEAGLALANTASLKHITVVGACATGTHGSGEGLGNLATQVSALDVVRADGELVTLRRGHDETFAGSVVSLGALGVVSRMTVDVEPTYELSQYLFADLPLDQLDEHLDEVMAAGYSVSLFPSFQRPHIETVWVKQRVSGASSPEPPTELFGAGRLADRLKPARADRTMTEINSPGPWHERLPHFSFLDPMLEGTELQSEYFVARQHAVPAIKAMAALGPSLASVIEIAELRTVAADELWLSPAYGHDVLAIHFNWFKDPAGVAAAIPKVEAALAPFDPRPHWGKLFDIPPSEIEAAYPRIGDFRDLMEEVDPGGKFVNDYIRANVLNQAS